MYTIEDLKEAYALAMDEDSGGEEIDAYREIAEYLMDDLIAAYEIVHNKVNNTCN